MHDKLIEIFKKYEGEKGAVITVLQKIQEKLGYLSKEAISEAAKFLRMSETEIFGIASFYAQFRFTPRGKHAVRVCLGTACHVRGGEGIMKAVENKLGIERGDTTKDQKFSIERVACFGSCALSPVMVVDKDVYGRMTPTKVKNILSKIK
jgi:NADH-quinone oxidoreductase E subunit